PPKNRDEFYEYAKRLTDAAPGRVGFVFSNGPAYHWSNVAWQSGAEIVRQAENGMWKSAIATPEGARAVDFYRKLVLDKWPGNDGKLHGPAAEVPPDFNEAIPT